MAKHQQLWVKAQLFEKFECDVDLIYSMIPQLQWKRYVYTAETRNKLNFLYLYCELCIVFEMVLIWVKLLYYVPFIYLKFHCRRGLVDQELELWFESSFS